MAENVTNVEPTNETPVVETPTEENHVEETPNVEDASAKEIAKLKALLSKANSEAAENKRKLREKMSEDERAKAEAEEERANMMAELEELKKEKTLSSYNSNFMKSGMDGESATACSTALIDGDMDSFFATLNAFVENTKKLAVASAMANQSGLSVGNQLTKEEIDKSELNARRRAIGLNPI